MRPRDLVVLGSGTSLPTEQRGPPGYLLRFAEGSGLLLDAGPGSVREAARYGVGPGRLRGALVSHFHPDHTADLIALIFARTSPYLADAPPLHLIGPHGLAALYERLAQVWGHWLRLAAGRLIFHEIEPGAIDLDIGGLQIEGLAVAMHHLPHSLGYRLRGAAGGTLAYSGDTGMGEGPLALGRCVDHYILEAAMPHGDGAAGHLTPALAAKVASQVRCKHLVLTHLYPVTERLDIDQVVGNEFDGDWTLASDGLVLDF